MEHRSAQRIVQMEVEFTERAISANEQSVIVPITIGSYYVRNENDQAVIKFMEVGLTATNILQILMIIGKDRNRAYLLLFTRDDQEQGAEKENQSRHKQLINGNSSKDSDFQRTCNTKNSTLRFSWRPSSVPLSAIGLLSP